MPIHILLAEDDEDDRMFFKLALSEAKTKTKLAEVKDGLEFTNYIDLIESPPPPDVVFLDINMPIKDGKECLQYIRANEKFKHIPVIMFSTSTRLKDIEESYHSGANLYVPKSLFFKDNFGFMDKIFTPNWRTDLLNVPRERFVMKN